jgi:hypothetical protein
MKAYFSHDEGARNDPKLERDGPAPLGATNHPKHKGR